MALRNNMLLRPQVKRSSVSVKYPFLDTKKLQRVLGQIVKSKAEIKKVVCVVFALQLALILLILFVFESFLYSNLYSNPTPFELHSLLRFHKTCCNFNFFLF